MFLELLPLENNIYIGISGIIQKGWHGGILARFIGYLGPDISCGAYPFFIRKNYNLFKFKVGTDTNTNAFKTVHFNIWLMSNKLKWWEKKQKIRS